MDEKVVVYSGTRNVYFDMITASKSLLAHTKVDRIIFVTEDEKPKFPYFIPDWFEVVSVKNQNYFSVLSPNRNSRLTYMVLMRTAYHLMFPNVKKVLQLDIDTIVNDDISALWDYDLTDYYLAAVKEPICSKGGKYERCEKYFNMGVALLNLEKLRDGMGNNIIRHLNTKKYIANEQGCINEDCIGHILELPNDFNSGNDWTGYSDNPIIIHYAGIKNWRNEELWKKYDDMSYEEALRLGGYN